MLPVSACSAPALSLIRPSVRTGAPSPAGGRTIENRQGLVPGSLRYDPSVTRRTLTRRETPPLAQGRLSEIEKQAGIFLDFTPGQS